MPYSDAHILIIGDSLNDIPTADSEAISIGNLLKSKGYPVVELLGSNATTKNILEGMYGADAIIYAGHGGYETGNYNMKGGVSKPPYAIVGSNDFIWGIGNKMEEGYNSQLFTAPIKQNIPVIVLQACFSTGWVENKQVSNPIPTIYNFARMFNGAGANYYATAYNGAGLDMIKEFLAGAKNFGTINAGSPYSTIYQSNTYDNVTIWHNPNGYSAFIGNWLGQFPKASQCTPYNKTAAEAWYNGDRTTNPYQSDLTVSNITAPTNGVSGGIIYVANTISNIVNASTSSFYVNYYLKKNSTSPNIYMGQSFITSLAGLASQNLNTKLKVPTNINAGSYYILAYADSEQTDPETNENNNQKLSSTKININGADLVITDISAKLKGTKTLEISNIIKNNGKIAASKYTIHYYIKMKGTTKNQYIGQYIYSGLKGNGTKQQNLKITLRKSIVASEYYIAAYVNANKTVPETNVTNNYKTGTIKKA
jgi:CARDB